MQSKHQSSLHKRVFSHFSNQNIQSATAKKKKIVTAAAKKKKKKKEQHDFAVYLQKNDSKRKFKYA